MVRKEKEVVSFTNLNLDKTTTIKRLILLILTLCFTVFLEILGFTLSAIIFLFFAIILLSSLKNWKNALIISLSCSLMGYFIFIYIFNTQFPRGVFENFIERIQDGK
jgi:cell division protein FtsW (lipid II flippase)